MSSPGAPPGAPTFEASKCAWIMARAVSSFIETSFPDAASPGCRLSGRGADGAGSSSASARACCGPPVPAMEGREVVRVPRVAQPGGAEVPVRADVAHDVAQVVPEVDGRGAPPEPVAVVDAVDHKSRLEHERVRDHRVVLGVGVLLD